MLEPVVPLNASAKNDVAPNDVYFLEQTARDLIKALELYQKMQSLFEPGKIRQHAKQFSAQHFRDQVHEYVQARLSEWWGVPNPC